MSRKDADDELQTDTRVTGSFASLSPTEIQVPALTILAHPDPRRVGELVALPKLDSGQTVHLSRLEPDFAPPGQPLLRPLSEAHLSRQPLLLVPGDEPDRVTLTRAGSRTKVEIDGQKLAENRGFSEADLGRGVVLDLGHRVILLLHWQHPITLQLPHFGMVGESSPMTHLRQEIHFAATLEAPVLLRGESGTGKELAARALHDAGARRGQPFVVVNMAAIPPSLAASELFGAARGAFTGADRRKEGFFGRAHGGTLFLDEIGETPTEIQPLLLRALESGEIQPVGGVDIQKADVRVITATDADLEGLVASGRFRAPLLHRLAGYEIRVPPVRERRSDFGRLLYHFLELELEKMGERNWAVDLSGRPWPAAELVSRLARHDWPGNIRQLRNVARRMAVSRRAGRAIALDALMKSLLDPHFDTQELIVSPSPSPTTSSASPPATTAAASDCPTLSDTLIPTGWRPIYRKSSDVTEEELRRALQTHRFELKPTAEALGLSRATLYDLIEGFPEFRKAADLEKPEIEKTLNRSGGDIDAAAHQLEVSRQGLKRRMKALGMR